MSEEIPKYKIIFLGDQGVGKSSILNRFAQDKFEQNYQATIGLDFHSKNITIENTSIRLLLYDTAGQEKFKSLIPMYIRDANIIIVVYDITSNFGFNFNKIYLILVKETFNHTIQWLNECKDLKREDAIFCLVGNKVDLSDKRSVTVGEAEALAKEKGLIFQEVSAKSGLNVNNLFYKDIFDQIARKYNYGGMGEFQLNEDNAKDSTNRSNIFNVEIILLINLDNNVVLDGKGENKENKPKNKKCC